jgi:hypothetical protein
VVAPLFRLSGVARRLQTAAGYAHSSRLGKTKNRQQRGTAGYFSRRLSGDPGTKDKVAVQRNSHFASQRREDRDAVLEIRL